MLSRRDLVGKIAASGAVLLAAGAASASLAPVSTGTDTEAGSGGVASTLPSGQKSRPTVDGDIPQTATAPAPWELIHPLALGSAVAHGWKVAGLSGAVDGSCVLTLQNERGRSHRVHLCRNAGNPQGLVFTDKVDLIVMNGGQGDLATDEGFAQAVAEVAHVLAANEGRHEVVASLMPHDERLRRFTGADRRLR
jgi:hypothetical protein